MTQPSGRVLGTRHKYRAYLRALPIFCAFDAAQLLICLALSPIFSSIPIRKALSQMMKARYGKSLKDIGGSEGVRQMILRWIFFVFGTLGPGLKMAAMKGITWTKAWGMIYLGSFLIFELAILLFRRSIRRERSLTSVAEDDTPDEVPLQRIGRVSTPSPEEDTLEAIPVQLTGISRSLNRAFYRLAAFSHSLVLVWAAYDLWRLRVSLQSRSDHTSDFMEPALYLLYISCVLAGYFCLIFSFGLVCNAVMGGEEAGSKIGIAFILCLEGIVTIIVTGVGKKSDGTLLLDMVLLMVLLGGPLVVFILVRLLCYSFPNLGKTLLGGDREGDTHPQDYEPFWILTLFLVSLLVSIMWYRFRYDPAGTVNPAWTGIFG